MSTRVFFTWLMWCGIVPCGSAVRMFHQFLGVTAEELYDVIRITSWQHQHSHKNVCCCSEFRQKHDFPTSSNTISSYKLTLLCHHRWFWDMLASLQPCTLRSRRGSQWYGSSEMPPSSRMAATKSGLAMAGGRWPVAGGEVLRFDGGFYQGQRLF